MLRRIVLLLILTVLPLTLTARPILEELPRQAVKKMTGTLQIQLKMKQELLAGDRQSCPAILLPRGTEAEALESMLVFVHVADYPSAKQLEDLHRLDIQPILTDWIPPLANHPNGIFLAKAPLAHVDELALLPWVRSLGSGEQAVAPQNDRAAVETGALELRQSDEIGVTGAGVRVGIFDSGLDTTFEDIPEAIVGVDYSAWPDSDFVITNTITGHGTHVAGTILGRGTLSEGHYAGMAPDAELVFIKIGDDAEALETSAGVAHSFIAAADYYDCDIVSMSYGYWNDFLDGSEEMEQAVDYAYEQGVLSFLSAGNSANDQFHYSADLAAGDSTDLIPLAMYGSAEGNFVLVNLVCYDSPDTSVHSPFSLTLYDENLETVDADLTEQAQSPRGTESRMIVSNDLIGPNPTYWYVRVTNQSPEEQFFHLYLNLQDHVSPDNWATYYFEEADSSYTIGAPATADKAIAVAAYTSKTQWTDYLGNPHTAQGEIGQIASFSSIGPRVDGVQKPEIAGPGRYVASCRDHDAIPLGGYYDLFTVSNPPDTLGEPADYVLMQGTSMACPAAAGSFALTLEEETELTLDEIRQALLETCRSDSFTGDTPNNTWGYGKLDVVALYEALHQGSVEPVQVSDALPERFALSAAYPNPFNSRTSVLVSLPQESTVRLRVYDVLGREVQRLQTQRRPAGSYRFEIDLTGHAGGVYFVHAQSGVGTTAAQKVVFVP